MLQFLPELRLILIMLGLLTLAQDRLSAETLRSEAPARPSAAFVIGRSVIRAWPMSDHLWQVEVANEVADAEEADVAESQQALLLATGPNMPVIEIQTIAAERFLHGSSVERSTTVPLSPEGRDRSAEILRVTSNNFGRLGPLTVRPLAFSTRLDQASEQDFWAIHSFSATIDLGPEIQPERQLDSASADQWTSALSQNPNRFPEVLNAGVSTRYLSQHPDQLIPEFTALWSRYLSELRSKDPEARAWSVELPKPGMHILPSSCFDHGPVRVYRDGRPVPVFKLPEGQFAIQGGQDYTRDERPDVVQVLASSVAPPWLELSDLKPLPEVLNQDPQTSKSADWKKKVVWQQSTRDPRVYDPKIRANWTGDRWAMAQSSPGGREVAISWKMPWDFLDELEEPVTLQLEFSEGQRPPAAASLNYAFNGMRRGNLEPGQTVVEFQSTDFKTGSQTQNLALLPDPASIRTPIAVRSMRVRWQQPWPTNFEIWSQLSSTTQSLSFEATGREASEAALEVSQNLRLTPSLWAIGQLESGETTVGQLLSAADQKGAWRFVQPDFVPDYAVRTLNLPQSLVSEDSWDGVIITPRQFLEAAHLLAQRRFDQQAFRFKVLPLEDAADFWGFGKASPQGLRTAVQNIAINQQGKPLEYLILLGECSDWPLSDSARFQGVSENFLPTFPATFHDPHGDFPYTRLTGEDDFPDLAVGRFPVTSLEEALQLVERVTTTTVAKVSDMEAAPTPFLHVLDDDPEFLEASRRGSWALGQNRITVFQQLAYGYVPYLKVEGKRRSWLATEAISRGWSYPWQAIVLYGHGGPNLFSHERLIHLSDLPTLGNVSPQAPLVACASCDNAWLDFPMAPVARSFGESMVLQPNAASAVFGPTAGATSYEHRIVMTHLKQALENPEIQTIGQAVRIAKNLHMARTMAPGLVRQYVLLGDPSMPIPNRSLYAERSKPSGKTTTGWPLHSSSSRRSPDESEVLKLDAGWQVQWGAGHETTRALDALRHPRIPIWVMGPENVPILQIKMSLTDQAGTMTAQTQFYELRAGQPRTESVLFERPPQGTTASLELLILTLDADQTPTTVVAHFQMRRPIWKGGNLRWLEAEGQWGVQGPPLALSTVFLAGTLINDGDMPTGRTDVQALIGHPTSGTVATTINQSIGITIPGLEPGSRHPVIFRWEDAKLPGTFSVFLAVNRPVQTLESQYEDNILPIGPIELQPMPDMRVENLATSPTVIKPGQSITFSFEASDPHPETRGPMEIVFGFRNPVSGQQNIRRISVADLQGKRRIEAPVVADAQSLAGYASINHDGEWEELDRESSQQTVGVDLVLSAEEEGIVVDKEGDTQLAFKEIHLAAARGEGWRYIPGQGLTLRSRASAQRFEILTTPQQALSMAAHPNQADTDLSGPPAWRYFNNSYQSDSPAKISDLVLRIPLDKEAFGLDQTATTVGVLLEIAHVHFPGKNQSFQLRLGEDPQKAFESYSSEAVPGFEARWIPIGKTQVTENGLILRVRPVPGQPVAIARVAIVVPASEVQSPWYGLPSRIRGGRITLSEISQLESPDGPYLGMEKTSHPIIYYRLGKLDLTADKIIPLTDWILVNNKSRGNPIPDFQNTGSQLVFQWKVISRVPFAGDGSFSPNQQIFLRSSAAPILSGMIWTVSQP